MARSPRLPLARTVRAPVLGAAICFALFAITGVLAYAFPVAQFRDAATLHGFTDLDRPRTTGLLSDIAHLADPAPYLLLGLIISSVAFLRGRARVGIAILLLLVVTGLTTQTLKPLLAEPRYSEWLSTQVSAASWPSGHATASMTLALCAILAAPGRLRPVVAAIAMLFPVAVSFSLLALAWHFPSDVIGGYLVAMFWTLLAVAAIALTDRRFPPHRPVARPWELREGWAAAFGLETAIAVGLAGAAFAVLLLRPRQVVDFAISNTTFLVGAGAIALLAVVLTAALARASQLQR